MRTALKAQINKTDRNDARGMPQMLGVPRVASEPEAFLQVPTNTIYRRFGGAGRAAARRAIRKQLGILHRSSNLRAEGGSPVAELSLVLFRHNGIAVPFVSEAILREHGSMV